MHTSRISALAVLLAAILAGCSNVDPELSKPAAVVVWPELQALQAPDVAMGIFRSMEMKDFKTMKATLVDPKLEELLKKLEDSKIPSNFASKAREDARSKLIKEYRYLINAAKGTGSNQDLKRSGDEVVKSLKTLADPALK